MKPTLFCLLLILLPQTSFGNIMVAQNYTFTELRTTTPTPWKIKVHLENHLVVDINVVEIGGTCTTYEHHSPHVLPAQVATFIEVMEKSCWKEFHGHHYRALTIKIKSDDPSFPYMFHMIELDDMFPNLGRKCLIYSTSKNYFYDHSVAESEVKFCGDNKEGGVPVIEAVVRVKYPCPLVSQPAISRYYAREMRDVSGVRRQTNRRETTVNLYVTNMRKEDLYIYRGIIWECWDSDAIEHKQKISPDSTRHFKLWTRCGTGSPSKLYYYLNLNKDMDKYPWAIGYLEVDYWEHEEYWDRLCRAGAGNTPAAQFGGDTLKFTVKIDYCVRSSYELDATDNYYVTVWP